MSMSQGGTDETESRIAFHLRISLEKNFILNLQIMEQEHQLIISQLTQTIN